MYMDFSKYILELNELDKEYLVKNGTMFHINDVRLNNDMPEWHVTISVINSRDHIIVFDDSNAVVNMMMRDICKQLYNIKNAHIRYVSYVKLIKVKGVFIFSNADMEEI